MERIKGHDQHKGALVYFMHYCFVKKAKKTQNTKQNLIACISHKKERTANNKEWMWRKLVKVHIS
jgi:hypothetical protein